MAKVTEKEFEDFKTMVMVKLQMVVVKLHLLRGCCETSTISKKQIAKSIEEFIKKITTPDEKKDIQHDRRDKSS